MKFIIKGSIKENIHNLARSLGYFFQREDDEEMAFTKPARGYPKFHLFLKIKNSDLVFNLHLDQKNLVMENLLLTLENMILK